MKQTRKSDGREQMQPQAPRTNEETARVTLRIQELEPRLAPQSSTSILD